MKLKTLKDLKKDWDNMGEIDTGSVIEEVNSDLKQEAIKWVKYYRELGLFGEAVSLGKFHNLTEGDLK